MHRKGRQDQKREKVFTKLVREIFIAAKSGSPDPAMNNRLRHAIYDAKSANLPKDKIDNAIKRASSTSESDEYIELRYEGYGPCGVAFIIEALSDNRNRTGGEVRAAFSKHGGTLGDQNSVSYMFDHVGRIIYTKESISNDLDNFMLHCLNADLAIDACNDLDTHIEIICSPSDFHHIKTHISDQYGIPEESDIVWLPQLPSVVTDPEKLISINKFINALNNLDDVQNVYGNFLSEM